MRTPAKILTALVAALGPIAVTAALVLTGALPAAAHPTHQPSASASKSATPTATAAATATATTTPTATVTATATVTPTVQATVTPTVTPSVSTSPTPAAQLPVTGVNIGWFLIGGGILVGVGSILYAVNLDRAARRRREFRG